MGPCTHVCWTPLRKIKVPLVTLVLADELEKLEEYALALEESYRTLEDLPPTSKQLINAFRKVAGRFYLCDPGAGSVLNALAEALDNKKE